jgi:hypothetical protein
VTFTLPQAVRALAFGHQRAVYGILMRSAAAALQRLAANPRYVGARVGCLAVLHTRTRVMCYHPHVHFLVTAGGLSAAPSVTEEPRVLVPSRAVILFRAKVCAGLRRAGLLDQVPPIVWTTSWVMHAQHAGRGQRVLEYLGRYVFRVAISNSRLEAIADGHVTFRARDNRTQEERHVTLTGVEFLERFLQHVLPRGCAKVRYYGLWSAARRADRTHAQALLSAAALTAPTEPTTSGALSASPFPTLPPCPHCQHGHLILIAVVRPQRKLPP